MSVSDASMTSEWHAHDAHAFMMRARHVRVVIAHMMRGVTSRAGGAARHGAARCDAHDEDGWLHTREGQDAP